MMVRWFDLDLIYNETWRSLAEFHTMFPDLLFSQGVFLLSAIMLSTMVQNHNLGIRYRESYRIRPF